MEDKDLKWRKASYSSNGGTDCVEVAGHDSRVMVRDTKDCEGPVLRFSAGVWRRFADHVKADASLASDPQAGPGGACRGIPVFRGCPIAVSGVPVLGDIRAVPRWRVVAVAGCRRVLCQVRNGSCRVEAVPQLCSTRTGTKSRWAETSLSGGRRRQSSLTKRPGCI